MECKDCRFFDPPTIVYDRAGPDGTWGVCKLAYSDENSRRDGFMAKNNDVLAMATATQRAARLEVSPDFSCNQFQKA